MNGANRQNLKRQSYVAPQLRHLDNLKDITFACEEWQCSVVVPPPPAH